MLADGKHGITTWSIEDPDHPFQLGTFDIPKDRFSSYDDVKMRADDRGTVYVSSRYGPLWAFDIQDPTDPKPLWNTKLRLDLGGGSGFDVRGTYLATAAPGGRVFNVNDPAEPVLIGEAGIGLEVALTANHVVTYWFNLIRVYRLDGNNPPELLETIELSDAPSDFTLWGADDLVFFSSSQLDWAVLDLSPGSGFAYTPLVNSLGWGYLRGMVFDNQIAYAAVTTQAGPRIEVLDFEDPSRPKMLDMSPEWGIPVLSEDRLFLVDRHEVSVRSLNVGLPNAGSLGPFGVAEKLLFDGDLGVLGDGPAGVVVFDFTDPDDPVELGRIEVGGWVDDVAVADGFAFLAADDAGFVVVDYRDPSDPTTVWQEVFPRADDIALDGRLALVAAGSGQTYGNGWMHVFDVADPEHPQRLASIAGYQTPGNTAVVASDGIAYFGSGDHVLIVDLSDPTAPGFLSTVRLISPWHSDSIGDLGLSGGRLLAACQSTGLVVVDVGDPSQPFVETTIEQPASVVSAANGLVYSDLRSKISAIDLVGSAEPTWQSFSNLRGLWAINPWRGRLYLASPPYVEVLSLECEPPEAAFEWQAHGRMVWFTNTSRFGWDQIEWFIDAGISITDQRDLMYYFESDGDHTVTLKISGEYGTSHQTQTVTVSALAAAEPAAPAEEVLQ